MDVVESKSEQRERMDRELDRARVNLDWGLDQKKGDQTGIGRIGLMKNWLRIANLTWNSQT